MGMCREAMCRIGNQQEGGHHNKIANRQDKEFVEASKVILRLTIHHLGPLRLSHVASRAGLQPKGRGCYPCL